MRKLSDFGAVFRDAGIGFSLEAAAFFAQALAFNALFAVIPLSLVVVSMFGYVYGTAEANARALAAVDTFAPQMHELVAGNLASAVRYRGISGTVGLVGLVWSAKNIFAAVAYSLDRSLGIPSRHFILEIIVAIVLVPLLGLVIIVATAVPVIISVVVRFAHLDSLRVAPQIASFGVSVLLVFALATLVYTYLPNRRAQLSFGVPGAAVTAVGYAITQFAFVAYTARANFAEIYGSLSTVLALLLWLYVMCAIFLYGAHFSVRWEARFSRAEPEM